MNHTQRIINDHFFTVAELRAKGRTRLFISHDNTEAWHSGFASYLMRNFEYRSTKHGLQVKISAPG